MKITELAEAVAADGVEEGVFEIEGKEYFLFLDEISPGGPANFALVLPDDSTREGSEPGGLSNARAAARRIAMMWARQNQGK